VLSLDDGRAAVRWARAALATGLGADAGSPRVPVVDPPDAPVFREPRGVFVTLKRHPSGDLRGCIGYPLPHLPLATAIARSAVAAATEDPRFAPVPRKELDRLTVEVSVLTVPVPLTASTPAGMIAEVTIGRDGLIVEGRGTSGLLLPQVGPEQGWTSEELLDGTCEKAGLPAGAWRDPRVRVRRFEAEVFAETTPGGTVERALG
jgi:uncharacterized protein